MSQLHHTSSLCWDNLIYLNWLYLNLIYIISLHLFLNYPTLPYLHPVISVK